MMKMAERLERALAPYLVGPGFQPCMSGDPRDRLTPGGRRRCSDAARAILNELREPTDSMVQAAVERQDNGDRESMYHSIWRAMIADAAKEA